MVERWFATKALRLLASLSTVFLSTAAWSQGAPPPPLPPQPQRDINGVDLAGWHVNLDWKAISIGTPEQGGMALTLYFLGSTYRDSFTADLTFPDLANSQAATATFGANTAYFDFNGNAVEPGTSVGPGSYVMKDGTYVLYSTTQGNCLPDDCPPQYYYATSAHFPNGEVLTYHNKIYAWHVRIQSITSNRGYQIKYEYKSNAITDYDWVDWGIRTKSTIINMAYEHCDHDADICSFSAVWPMVSRDFPVENGVTVDQYTNSAGEVYKINGLSVSLPGSSGYNLIYTGELYYTPFMPTLISRDWRVRSASRSGKTWNYSYLPNNSANPTVTISAPDGSTSEYDVSGGGPSYPSAIDRFKDGLNRETTFTYNSFGKILTTHFPEGNYDEVTYDSRGNVTQYIKHPKSGLVTSIVYAYPSNELLAQFSYNKPTLATDERGKTTNYSWSPSHGGIISEMKPPPSDGAARPLRLFTYIQKSAYVLNSGGVLVSTGQPVWLLDTTTECQTEAGSSDAVCDAAAPKVVTSYQYGGDGTADNLLIHGKSVLSDGQVVRTCYSYDKWSNKVSETLPNALLGVCP